MHRCGADVTAGHLKFNWDRYVDFAEVLLNSMAGDEDDELKDRCGISRAYYGAFHRAQAYLHKIGITIDINNVGSHKRVIEEFKKIGASNKLWSGIGLELDRLKKQRKRADYDDRYFADNEKNLSLKKQLEQSVIRARFIIERINEIEKKELH